MLFITNKYTTWYTRIISQAQNRTLLGYSETHHIIPKSLGGTNGPENLVRLTAREHFICHVLLTKMTTGKHFTKMCHAAWMMANCKNELQKRYKATSKMYAKLKEAHATNMSTIMASNNPMADPLIRQRHREALARRGKTTGNTGQQHSEETKAKMRAARRTQVITDETKQKLSIANTGKRQTDETKEKRAAKHRGRKNTKKCCPFCLKMIAEPNYTRWHNHNCKMAV